MEGIFYICDVAKAGRPACLAPAIYLGAEAEHKDARGVLGIVHGGQLLTNLGLDTQNIRKLRSGHR
jgi:hypothetical protein